MGLSMYVWFSQLGFPHTTLEFPYKRQSPITKENKEYESIEDATKELYGLVDTFIESKFTLGRNLYFHIPLFANPKWFVQEEFKELIREYNYMKNFNLPLAVSLDEADSYKLECFEIINNELNAIQQYLGEKNG